MPNSKIIDHFVFKYIYWGVLKQSQWCVFVVCVILLTYMIDILNSYQLQATEKVLQWLLLQWLLLRLSIRFGAAWHHSPSVKSSEEKYFYSHRSLVLPNCTFKLCVPATAPFTCQVRQYSIRGMYSLEEEEEVFWRGGLFYLFFKWYIITFNCIGYRLEWVIYPDVCKLYALEHFCMPQF